MGLINKIKNSIKNSKPTDPSRRLGYHTYYNNMITQIFLKFRVLVMVLLFAGGVSIAVPLVLNLKLFKIIAEILDILGYYRYSVFHGQGKYYFLKTFGALGQAILISLAWSILLFIILFPISMAYLTWRSRKAYEKKYIRGIEVMPMKKLIKQLRNEN